MPHSPDGHAQAALTELAYLQQHQDPGRIRAALTVVAAIAIGAAGQVSGEAAYNLLTLIPQALHSLPG